MLIYIYLYIETYLGHVMWYFSQAKADKYSVQILIFHWPLFVSRSNLNETKIVFGVNPIIVG